MFLILKIKIKKILSKSKSFKYIYVNFKFTLLFSFKYIMINEDFFLNIILFYNFMITFREPWRCRIKEFVYVV